MKTALIILIFFLLHTHLLAQIRDIGIIAAPSLSNIHTGGKAKHFKYIIPFNYGFYTTVKREKFILSSGILHLTQGAKHEVLQTSSSNPEGTGEYFDIIIRAKTITVPVTVNYVFKVTEKTELFGGVGIYAGYVYSQQQENTSFSANSQPDSSVLPVMVPKRFADISIFDKYFFAANIGIGLRHSISDKFSIQLRPNFIYQLRKNLPKDRYAWTNRLMSFSLDTGLSYCFWSED